MMKRTFVLYFPLLIAAQLNDSVDFLSYQWVLDGGSLLLYLQSSKVCKQEDNNKSCSFKLPIAVLTMGNGPPAEDK